MSTLTYKQRLDIINTWKATKSKKYTADIHGVSLKTVIMWTKRFVATGDVKTWSVLAQGPL
jgi:transposase